MSEVIISFDPMTARQGFPLRYQCILEMTISTLRLRLLGGSSREVVAQRVGGTKMRLRNIFGRDPKQACKSGIMDNNEPQAECSAGPE